MRSESWTFIWQPYVTTLYFNIFSPLTGRWLGPSFHVSV